MQRPQPSTLCLIVGMSLFIAGFFLPAARPTGPNPGASWFGEITDHDIPGWQCAAVTLLGAAGFFRHLNSEAIPAAAIGWINPLLLFYLLSFRAKKLQRFRSFTVAAIVVCCIAMWIQLVAYDIKPLLGHYLWIAGIALILSAPLANRVSTPSHSGENTT